MKPTDIFDYRMTFRPHPTTRTLTLPAAQSAGQAFAVYVAEGTTTHVQSPTGRALGDLSDGETATFKVRRFLWWRWWVRAE